MDRPHESEKIQVVGDVEREPEDDEPSGNFYETPLHVDWFVLCRMTKSDAR